jgi:endoglucanase
VVTSPAFDNKCGTFVVMEALRLCSEKLIKCALYSVSTVQEELGLRGARTSAYGVDPQVGIAVDVTHATDYPDIDKRTNGDLKIGGGPVISTGANINPKLESLLVAAAKSHKIAHQVEAEPLGTGTDANAIQLNRAGVATALVSIPNRYMHTPVEVVSLGDLEAAARLLAETIASIDKNARFIPS